MLRQIMLPALAIVTIASAADQWQDSFDPNDARSSRVAWSR
jgi:hypothetical protein